MRRVVVVLSGGQDSTTCLFYAMKKYDEVFAVTFNYGQRHDREIMSARIMAGICGVEHEVIDIPDILKGTSPLVNKAVELEQYMDHHSLPGGLEKTFVPMRNQLFLTIAANRAICLGADILVTGVCQEDFGGYPDCRQVFIDALENAIQKGTALEPNDAFGAFIIDTPLMDLTKAASIDLAMTMPGCYGALGFSHTSYDGAYPPTGHDHATLLRAKGFEEVGVPDPLVVRAYWETHMELPQTENYIEFAARISANSPWKENYGGRSMHPIGIKEYNHNYVVKVAAALERIVNNV